LILAAWITFAVGAAWMLWWGLWGSEPTTPWVPMAMLAMAPVLAWAGVRSERTSPRLLSGVLLTALGGIAWTMILVVMAFPGYDQPRRAPSFRSTDADGAAISSESLEGPTLLVFFRGRW